MQNEGMKKYKSDQPLRGIPCCCQNAGTSKKHKKIFFFFACLLCPALTSCIVRVQGMRLCGKKFFSSCLEFNL
jgi:hypothetical protein